MRPRGAPLAPPYLKPSTPLDLDRRLTSVDFRRVPRYLFDVLSQDDATAGELGGPFLANTREERP